MSSSARKKAKKPPVEKVIPPKYVCATCEEISEPVTKTEIRVECENDDCKGIFHLVCQNVDESLDVEDIDHFFCLACQERSNAFQIIYFPSGLEKLAEIENARSNIVVPWSLTTTKSIVQESVAESSRVRPSFGNAMRAGSVIAPEISATVSASTYGLQTAQITQRDLTIAFGEISDDSSDEDDFVQKRSADAFTVSTELTPEILHDQLEILKGEAGGVFSDVGEAVPKSAQYSVNFPEKTRDKLDNLLQMASGPSNPHSDVLPPSPDESHGTSTDDNCSTVDSSSGVGSPAAGSSEVADVVPNLEGNQNFLFNLDHVLTDPDVLDDIDHGISVNPIMNREELIECMRHVELQKECLSTYKIVRSADTSTT